LPGADLEDEPGTNATYEFPADGLDLAASAAPVAWGKGRWPSVDWINGELIQVRARSSDGGLSLIRARQDAAGGLLITGVDSRENASDWLRRTLGWGREIPEIGDQLIADLFRRNPGLRPYAHGSLEQALLTAIIGQGVTVQAGAVMERRVAEIHSAGCTYAGRTFLPFPASPQLADTLVERLRSTGLTWRRAEGIARVARIAAEGGLPSDAEAIANPETTMARLKDLPMIGPWSAAAALLWGLAADDAHVTGDVALLRAAKQEYDRPDLTLKTLDHLAEGWRPGRAWAARVLWLRLLGPAPVAPGPVVPRFGTDK
jgi:3-methyladenine DNA glycosylase/8-oxoguanine DNA glycosylase